MKKSNIFLLPPHLLFYSISLFFFIISCVPEEPSSADLIQADLKTKSEKINDFYGPAKHMGNGVVRSVISINHEGIPTAIGIEISEKVLENLPVHEGQNLHLQLSNKAEGLGLLVDHIDIGWNPEGHEPEGIYTIPHFDLHFYWISVGEVDAIEFGVGMADAPEMKYWPVDYTPDGVTIPKMGRHWIYDYAPELPNDDGSPGETFTQTFIYGSYNYEFTFYEPMVTKDFFEARNFASSYNISQPENFQKSGYYASSYEISYDEVKKQYRVMLTDLHWEDGEENL